MAELYFFKLHPVIARINLYNAICRDPESIFPFLPKDQDTFLELLKIKAKENRIAFFDANKQHQATTCTDEKYKIVVNFNYQ